nr:MAG TPA: type I neck protein [Caudoviricetes sp.]
MSVKFRPNKRAAEAILKGSEVQALLARKAAEVAARAGEGFTSGVRVGKDRARAYVLPETYKARKRQARDHVLERAVGRG